MVMVMVMVINIIHSVPTGVNRLHIGRLDVAPLQQCVRLYEVAVLHVSAYEELRTGDEVMWP